MSSENARFDGQSIDGGMGDFEGSTFLDAAQDRQHVASSIDDCFGQEEILSFVSEIENAPVVEAREFYHDAELNFPGRMQDAPALDTFDDFGIGGCENLDQAPSTPRAPHVLASGPKLAKYRYGHEEFLAMFSSGATDATSTKLKDLFREFYIERAQGPVTSDFAARIEIRDARIPVPNQFSSPVDSCESVDFKNLMEFLNVAYLDQQVGQTANGATVQTLPESREEAGATSPAESLDSTAPVPAVEQIWYYIDPDNSEQGPFPSSKMAKWFSAGYFTMQLRVRRDDESEFVALGDLIKRCGRVPFINVTTTASNDSGAQSRSAIASKERGASEARVKFLLRRKEEKEKRLAEEMRVREAEAQRKEEKEKRLIEEMRVREEEDAQRKILAETIKRAEEERRLAELRAHEEKLRKLEEEIRLQEQLRQKAEEEVRRLEEEQRKRARLQEEEERRTRREQAESRRMASVLAEEDRLRKLRIEKENGLATPSNPSPWTNKNPPVQQWRTKVNASPAQSLLDIASEEERQMRAEKRQDLELGFQKQPASGYEYSYVCGQQQNNHAYPSQSGFNEGPWSADCSPPERQSPISPTMKPGEIGGPLTKWCMKQVRALNVEIDAAEFVDLLNGMESPGDIERCILSRFGDCGPTREFVVNYLHKRRLRPPSDRDSTTSGGSNQPTRSKANEPKKRAKTPKVIVNGGFLGFFSTADPNRFNAGATHEPTGKSG